VSHNLFALTSKSHCSIYYKAPKLVVSQLKLPSGLTFCHPLITEEIPNPNCLVAKKFTPLVSKIENHHPRHRRHTMRLPSLAFRSPPRPILPTPSTSLTLPPIRHKTEVKPSFAMQSRGWNKNANAAKQAAKSANKAKLPGSNNPFLQGANFDRNDSRVTLARGMLFSQRPLRGPGLNPQDEIRHETIHRAWMLVQSRKRRSRISRLRVLEASVAKTMKALRETDRRLYDLAVSGAREEEQRFPLVMRIPSETLPTTVWNYNWTASNIKGVGGIAKESA